MPQNKNASRIYIYLPLSKDMEDDLLKMNGSGAGEDVDGNEGGSDEEGSDVVSDELDRCVGHEVAAEIEGGH
jgi:hypothetical protein